MTRTRTAADGLAIDDGPAAGAAPGELTVASRRTHAASGVTTSLILAYLERELGRPAVDRVLQQTGLTAQESALRNEGSWFDFDTKIALWTAVEEVTGDRAVARHVGESVLDFSVGLGVKRALRAFGSPDLVFRNVARANTKFNWAHTIELTSLESGRARLRYQDLSDVGYHRYDCEYTIGLLSTVPELFGLPAARAEHPRCGTRGEGWCEFDVQWTTGLLRTKQLGALGGAVSLALIGAGALLDPVVAAGGAAFGALAAGAAALRMLRFMRHRLDSLEAQVREQNREADVQLRSLTTLSSDLRIDEVLEQITVSAGEVVVGAKFALLISEPQAMRANRCEDIPAATIRCLEAWAHSIREHLEAAPIVMDDLSTHRLLCSLTTDGAQPFGSLCAAPLLFGGRLLGVLIALARGSTVFFPHDVRALATFAGHAAIALSNARLVGELERQAAEDPLTGLPNRRAFELACLTEIDRAAREDTSVVLAILDVDHFKRINDTHGHQYGDEVLASVARCLRSAVRGHDTVARLGGEEFAVLLPATELDYAAAVVERARAAVATIALTHGGVTCSAGVARTRGGQAQMADLFAEADSALYRAKALGRGRTEIAATDADAESPAAAA
jgi:diguanylate cyclase (GGDEF)-like protein